jgi:hypothetical protein
MYEDIAMPTSARSTGSCDPKNLRLAGRVATQASTAVATTTDPRAAHRLPAPADAQTSTATSGKTTPIAAARSPQLMKTPSDQGPLSSSPYLLIDWNSSKANQPIAARACVAQGSRPRCFVVTGET